MNSPKISVVPFTYKRSENLTEQLQAIENQTIDVHEIVIGHLCNEKTEEFDFRDYQVISMRQDPGFRSKFCVATFTDPDTDIIAIVDDDCIWGEKWLENCLETMKEYDSCVAGGLGCNFNDYYYDHVSDRNKTHQESKSVDFIGQCWVMPYHCMNLYLENQLEAKTDLNIHSGTDDIWFSHVMHKWDNHTVVPSKPKDDKEMWHNEKMLTGNTSLCEDYNEHKSDRKKIIKHIKEKG